MSPLREVKDLEALRKVALLLEQENEKLVQKNLELRRELMKLKHSDGHELQLLLGKLEQELQANRKQIFGEKSEQRPASEDKQDERKKPSKGHGPRQQPSLPIEDEIHLLDEPDQACPKCGGQLAEWEGQFEESEEIDVIPRRYVIRRHLRQKYRCGCQACVETALGPPKLIPGGRYSPDFAVDVAVSKYLDHLPLARQQRMMARDGLVVERATLWDQIDALARRLAPLHERLHAHVLSNPVIGVDETHWKFLGSNGGEHAQKRWQTWTVGTDDAVSYRIMPSRSAEAARQVLVEFEGIVVADGYGVYEHLAKQSGLRVANCWAHARRKFYELENAVPDELRHEILDLIGELYAVEREAQGDVELRARLRDTRSRAAVARLREWLFAQKRKALPRSALGKAVSYTIDRWAGLTRFLDDARIPLDNNASERSLRGPVVGRKNHYGSKSERGTKVAALFYSLCESAKLVGIDPRVYLRGAVAAVLQDEEAPLPHELRAQADAARE